MISLLICVVSTILHNNKQDDLSWYHMELYYIMNLIMITVLILFLLGLKCSREAVLTPQSTVPTRLSTVIIATEEGVSIE